MQRGFAQAKGLAADRLRADAVKQHMSLMTPWFSTLFADNRDLLGRDWWPCGLAANRTAVETFLRYHHEQGLSPRLSCEDIFAEALLDT